MLSRVAESLYWIGRYLERAEHSARVIRAMRGVRLELFEVNTRIAEAQWRGALRALTFPELSVARLVFDPGESTSLLCSISRARENARQVRDALSPEMWEQINQTYWSLREQASSDVNESVLSEALTRIVSAGFMWDGVTDASMNRGEGWLFLKLGKFSERIEGLSRLVATRLTAKERERSSENVEWLILLKSLDAVDAYKNAHPARVDRRAVLDFVLFEAAFPRALRYSTAHLADLARRLRNLHPEAGRDIERSFGRVAARVEYADIETVEAGDTARFLLEIVGEMNEAAFSIQRTFFLS
ncbi:MAG TPA: alpha-E domain-containing protein [Polyangiaceae bacterium]|nr:alpha-E domain-containing protein [Polyangiaceae bacterium]